MVGYVKGYQPKLIDNNGGYDLSGICAAIDVLNNQCNALSDGLKNKIDHQKLWNFPFDEKASKLSCDVNVDYSAIVDLMINKIMNIDHELQECRMQCKQFEERYIILRETIQILTASRAIEDKTSTERLKRVEQLLINLEDKLEEIENSQT